MEDIKAKRFEVVIVATPTHMLLQPLIHELSHQSNFQATILTRETSISLTPAPSSHSHGHNHNHNHDYSHEKSTITHQKTDFTPSSLQQHFRGKTVLICIFSGSDLHFSPKIIDAAQASNINLFIPSEYGLPTPSQKIRDLLPPYQTRFEVQSQLKKSPNMKWKAIYAGIMLEDGLKTDGVLGIDVQWGSVTVFPGAENLKIAISTYEDLAKFIINVLQNRKQNEETQIFTATFSTTLHDLVEVIEKELDRKLDRYEANPEAARKEASERMKMGYFDGGVALMGRIAVWETGRERWE